MKIINVLGWIGVAGGLLMFLPEILYGPGSGNAAYGMGGFFVIVFTLAAWVFFALLATIGRTARKRSRSP